MNLYLLDIKIRLVAYCVNCLVRLRDDYIFIE